MKTALFLRLTAVFLPAALAGAETRLPALISDHAVFQADARIAIRGWAAPGARLHVEFMADDRDGPNGFDATADAGGGWCGELNPMKSGTAGRLIITSDRAEQKTVEDILVGEVWLAGGQSNMEYDLAATGRSDPTNPAELAEVAQNVTVAQREADAAEPRIRYFKVAARGSDEPVADVKGTWVMGGAANVAKFSAVAWNFGVALQHRLHGPVGLIVSCVGNTPIEAWMSRESLARTTAGPAIQGRHHQALARVTPAMIEKYQADTKLWSAENPTPLLQQRNQRTRPVPPYTPTSNRAPSRFYNGMISGLTAFTLRGIIWFQADGNGEHPLEYAELFQTMIKQWRDAWRQPRLPFLFVEVNNMREEKQTHPVQPNSLSLIREQQHGGLLQPGVGMVCAIDLGDRNPHFPWKKPVGERLAGLALRDCYGQAGRFNSPMYERHRVDGNKIRLTFRDAEGLRLRSGNELIGFAIRDAAGAWVWAEGRIDGEEIWVWSDRISTPCAVRYAWAMNPVISVENGAGLPLIPFRTDPESPL